MRRFFFACVFAVGLAIPATVVSAQSCNVYPWYFMVTASCGTGESVCPPGSPVTFTPSLWNGTQSECATITWSFGDGSPTITAPGNQSVSHSYSYGSFVARASIRTSNYPFPEERQVYIAVAAGRLSWSGATVTEGNTTQARVTRTSGAGATSLAWTLRTSTGQVPADVTPTSGVVDFAEGQTAAYILFTSADDTSYTGSRTYTLTAVSATNDFLMPPSPTEITVAEDDFALLSIVRRAANLREDSGAVTLTVTRSGASNARVSVAYAAEHEFWWSSVSRIVPTFGRLTFEPGEVSKTFSVTLLNDNVWSAASSFRVRLSSPSEAGRIDAQSSEYALMVEDDDPLPTFVVSSPRVVEGDTDVRTATIVVTAAHPLQGSYTYSTVDESATSSSGDYVFSSGSITFNNSTTASFTVAIRGDVTPEADERFRVQFSAAAQAPRIEPTTITIVNDDANITPATFSVEQGKSTTASLTLGLPSPTAVVIPLSSSRPEIASVPATVTVPAGESRASFEIRGVAGDVGAVRITAAFSQERGGPKSISGYVHRAGRVVFSPASIEAYPGQEVPVRVTVADPTGSSYDVRLKTSNSSVVSAPAAVTIMPDGTGTFIVKALKTGAARVEAAPAGPEHDFAFVDINVNTAPQTPTLASVTPATGPTAGGTEFTALGANVTADCTLAFGGVPVPNITIGSTGAISGITPPHAVGTVDVTLSCGTSTYILSNAFTYVPAPPMLSAIAPSFGSTKGGTLVRATGTNFQSGCWMFFGELASPAVEVDSTTSLVAVAPARAESGPVHVRVQCGEDAATRASAFTYSSAAEPAASLISVDPLVGAPGETVTMTGSRFRADDTVRFDQTQATILRARPDQHVVRIPELPLGMSSITLTDTAGRVTTTGPIFLIVEPAPPRVERVSPATALPGSDVTLHGRGFRPAYSFTIGGQAARTVSLAYDRAVVRVADGVTPGSHRVQVVNSDGFVSSIGPAIEIRDAALRLRGIAPACGSTAGGTVVTLTGAGFDAGTTVTFNGVAATDVTIVSDAELRATAPAGATGAATVVVKTGAHESASTGLFRYVSPLDPQGCSTSNRVRSVGR